MKRLLVQFSSFALVLLVQGAPAPKNNDDFPALVKKLYQAWNTLDVEKPAAYYAKEADLVFYDIAPLKYDHGWKEYSANFRTNVAPTFTSLSLSPHEDLKVTRRGNIALTTLTFHAAARLKQGGSMDFDGRHTLLWEKRGEQWLILHEHVSKPID